MIGWFLLSKRYWDDVFYTEILPEMKEEDFIVTKGRKGERIYIRKERSGKLFLA